MKNFIWLFICIAFACKQREILPPSPVFPIPAQEQLDWQEKELFAFVHFTVNTFTDKEWGYGNENPDVFNPVEFDPEQWAKVLKDAGFKGAILTAKHHDGFCLWPSKITEHSVKNISWRNGKGDVVGEFKQACDKYGLEFGIYLSPWDRNRADYGSPSYVEYYQSQLKELFGSYSPVFEIWFDGANGGDGWYGGASEKRSINQRSYYDWPSTYKILRTISPETIIRGDARTNADARWCGNEEGYIGEENWNLITPDSLPDDAGKRIKFLNEGDESGARWMPAEVDVSIRPGWFYHESEDSLVKTPDQLFDIYLSSVGRGSPLLLNVAPNRQGLIPEQDVHSLQGWKKKIDETFTNNLTSNAVVMVNTYRGNSEKFGAANLVDEDEDTYWATDDSLTDASIQLDFKAPEVVQYIILQEYIKLGQRVKSFNIQILKEDNWVEIISATTIGYKRIVKIEPTRIKSLKINITKSKACPAISNISVY